MKYTWNDLRKNPDVIPHVPDEEVLICYIDMSGKRRYDVIGYSERLWKYIGVIGWKYIDDLWDYDFDKE